MKEIELSAGILEYEDTEGLGINSPEWERRQRWYGFHEKESA
jgi:hypothetical protein